MNKKSKGKPFERINLMLDRRQLEKAMAVAIEGGEPVAEVGNRSGFVRWLLRSMPRFAIARTASSVALPPISANTPALSHNISSSFFSAMSAIIAAAISLRQGLPVQTNKIIS